MRYHAATGQRNAMTAYTAKSESGSQLPPWEARFLLSIFDLLWRTEE